MLLEIEFFKNKEKIITIIIIIIIYHYYPYYYFNFYNKEVFFKKLELKVWVPKSDDPQFSNTPKLLPPHWGM